MFFKIEKEVVNDKPTVFINVDHEFVSTVQIILCSRTKTMQLKFLKPIIERKLKTTLSFVEQNKKEIMEYLLT